MKAVKFGGTSMSTADSILRVSRIVKSDAERRFVVVSAPGKADGENKVTDMLVAVAAARPTDRAKLFAHVRERFENIVAGVGLPVGFLKSELDGIERALETAGRDYIVSRGEHLSAYILAELLGYEFVDAAKLVKFNGEFYDDDYTE